MAVRYEGKNCVESGDRPIGRPSQPLFYDGQWYRVSAGITDKKVWVIIDPDNPEFAAKLIDRIERTKWIHLTERGIWVPG